LPFFPNSFVKNEGTGLGFFVVDFGGFAAEVNNKKPYLRR